MNARRWLLLAGAAIAIIVILLLGRAREKAVAVVTPAERMVTETIAASGRLRGAVESDIGAQNQGRVAAILVREGDVVRTGQVIAWLDDRVLQAQVTQAQVSVRTAEGQLAKAEAAVKTARAEVAQASRPPLAADVAKTRADVAQNDAVNAAKLAAARQKAASSYQRYRELAAGSRPEEVEQAEAEVAQAQANLTQYERDWKRQQALYEQEVVARSEAEQAETSYQVGRQTLENARAKLRQLRAGNRREEIAQARADWRAAQADVASAEATLSGGRRSGQAQIASLLSSPRPEDVAVAQRRLAEAERSRDVTRDQLAEARIALTLAQRRLSESAVTAPFAGTVTQVVTEVGAVTGANTPVVRLVRTGAPEIHVDLDESNLGKLRVGQKAVVTSDAFPDARFGATVRAIGAQVDTDRGTVEVRLTPDDPPAWVRPGQTFTVNIVAGEPRPLLVVPVTAVTTISGVSSLLAVEGGRVVKKEVRSLPPGEGGVPIVEGITAQAQVIAEPVGLTAGQAVRAEAGKPQKAQKAEATR